MKPRCANILKDSFYCDGEKTKYTFYVKNNAAFPLYHVDFRTSDPSVKLNQTFVNPNPPIQPDSIGGPFTVVLDSFDDDLINFVCT